MSLFTLLVIVLVIGLAIYAVQLIPGPAPVKNIALIIVVLIAIFYLLGLVGIGPGLRVR